MKAAAVLKDFGTIAHLSESVDVRPGALRIRSVTGMEVQIRSEADND